MSKFFMCLRLICFTAIMFSVLQGGNDHSGQRGFMDKARLNIGGAVVIGNMINSTASPREIYFAVDYVLPYRIIGSPVSIDFITTFYKMLKQFNTHDGKRVLYNYSTSEGDLCDIMVRDKEAKFFDNIVPSMRIMGTLGLKIDMQALRGFYIGPVVGVGYNNVAHDVCKTLMLPMPEMSDYFFLSAITGARAGYEATIMRHIRGGSLRLGAAVSYSLLYSVGSISDRVFPVRSPSALYIAPIKHSMSVQRIDHTLSLMLTLGIDDY